MAEQIETGRVVRIFAAYIDRVLAGETFVLTRKGRPVAVLGPVAKDTEVPKPKWTPKAPATRQPTLDAVADPVKPGKATVQSYSQRQSAQAGRDKILSGVKTR